MADYEPVGYGDFGKILRLEARIAELEAERDALALKVRGWEKVAELMGDVFGIGGVPERVVNLLEENAALRKARIPEVKP